MYGQMDESSKGHGKVIKCMGEEFSFGLTAANIKANIIQIRKKVMDNFPGLMGDATRVNGEMASKMAREPIAINREFRGVALG